MISEQVTRDRNTALVIALVGKEAAPHWWNSPNKGFDGRLPCVVEPREVYKYLMKFAGGEYH